MKVSVYCEDAISDGKPVEEIVVLSIAPLGRGRWKTFEGTPEQLLNLAEELEQGDRIQRSALT